jgi:hypothetical protein
VIHRVETWSTGSGHRNGVSELNLFSGIYSGIQSRPGFVSFHLPHTPLRRSERNIRASAGRPTSPKFNSATPTGPSKMCTCVCHSPFDDWTSGSWSSFIGVAEIGKIRITGKNGSTLSCLSQFSGLTFRRRLDSHFPIIPVVPSAHLSRSR